MGTHSRGKSQAVRMHRAPERAQPGRGPHGPHGQRCLSQWEPRGDAQVERKARVKQHKGLMCWKNHTPGVWRKCPSGGSKSCQCSSLGYRVAFCTGRSHAAVLWQ